MENPLLRSSNPAVSSVYTQNLEKLIDSIQWKEGDVIMDYGCGNGKFMTEFLVPKINVNPRCVCGVDISPQLIRFAYENCKDKKENIYFAIGDIMNKWTWTFKENLVNKFVAYLVLCFVEDYRSFISKVHDFLKPGGQMGMLIPLSKAYGLPYQLLRQEKWSKYAKNGSSDSSLPSSFASWTYSEEIDAPSAIKEALVSAGFKIEKFNVEETKLEFPSARNVCDFLCNLTSALSAIPEELQEEFKQEMESLIINNFSNAKNDGISIEWRFLNFVGSKSQ